MQQVTGDAQASATGYGWSAETPGSAAYINPAVLRLARESGAHTVIDAGCGNGVLAGLLADHGFAVLGIDADSGGIALARAAFPNAQFAVGGFGGPPSRQVDLVVSTEVVEHLYAPDELVAFCHGALRPGGTLIISAPYHGYLKNLAIALAGKWDDHHTANWRGGHIKFWSRATLTRLLAEGGFRVTRVVRVGRLPFLWKSMILVAHKAG